jgi:hypothetical protein
MGMQTREFEMQGGQSSTEIASHGGGVVGVEGEWEGAVEGVGEEDEGLGGVGGLGVGEGEEEEGCDCLWRGG